MMGSPHDFAGPLSLIRTHRVRPVPISGAFPLDRAADPHAFLEQGSGFGRVLTHQ